MQAPQTELFSMGVWFNTSDTATRACVLGLNNCANAWQMAGAEFTTAAVGGYR